MCVYLRTKFEVSSIILARFRQGGGVVTPPPPTHTHTPQNEPLKNPPRLGLVWMFRIFSSLIFFALFLLSYFLSFY